MVQFYVAAVILSVAFCVSHAAVPDFCSTKTCAPLVSSRPEFSKFCSSVNGTVNDRCCVANSSVVALDYTSCQLTKLDVLQSAIPIGSRMSLEFMLLDSNPINAVVDNSFFNYVKLNYVSVPSPLSCPGAAYMAWNLTAADEAHNATVCQIQVTYCQRHSDACIELAEYPDNAYCVPQGPSLFECPCSEGVYGYKCLRRGQFPTAIFAPVISISTVALSAFLWYTQRRFVVAPIGHTTEHQQ